MKKLSVLRLAVKLPINVYTSVCICLFTLRNNYKT